MFQEEWESGCSAYSDAISTPYKESQDEIIDNNQEKMCRLSKNWFTFERRFSGNATH